MLATTRIPYIDRVVYGAHHTRRRCGTVPGPRRKKLALHIHGQATSTLRILTGSIGWLFQAEWRTSQLMLNQVICLLSIHINVWRERASRDFSSTTRGLRPRALTSLHVVIIQFLILLVFHSKILKKAVVSRWFVPYRWSWEWTHFSGRCTLFLIFTLREWHRCRNMLLLTFNILLIVNANLRRKWELFCH